MDIGTIFSLAVAILIFVVALLYSTVGHAGASGYLAVMALFGMAPLVMKPTALTLNIIVALIGTISLRSCRILFMENFLAFCGSFDSSFIHRRQSHLTRAQSINPSWGLCLLYSAVRLFFSAATADVKKPKLVPIWMALVLGAAIGAAFRLNRCRRRYFSQPSVLLPNALGRDQRDVWRVSRFYFG